jgi:hypothetical protein
MIYCLFTAYCVSLDRLGILSVVEGLRPAIQAANK